MLRAERVLATMLFALMLSACSVDISGPATATLPAPPTPGASIFVTMVPRLLSPIAPTELPGSGPAAAPATLPPTAPLTNRIPVTWAALKLSGKMVLTSADLQQQTPVWRIQSLDLSSGEISTIFQSTDGGWLYYMSASSSGQIVMSYAASPGNSLPGQQALYVLPLDGSKVHQLLFTPPTVDDRYLQAEWSPDGKYIYYVHSFDRPQTPGQTYPTYEIYRMQYPDGQPERIAQYAFWPRVSPDSAHIVFVSSNPQDGKNKLYIANADGSAAQEIPLSGASVPDIIDAPIFSPDGGSILFSAPTPVQARRPNWLEWLLGIQVAEAHTVPSEWWSVPIGGGAPQQLTHIQSPVLFASISPDGRWIASYSGNGLFVMKPDATALTTLISDLGGMAGMVAWLP